MTSKFGDILYRRRDQLHMTRAQFARYLGCTASNLRDLEDGRAVVNPLRAAKMAEKLAVSADEARQAAEHDEQVRRVERGY